MMALAKVFFQFLAEDTTLTSNLLTAKGKFSVFIRGAFLKEITALPNHSNDGRVESKQGSFGGEKSHEKRLPGNSDTIRRVRRAEIDSVKAMKLADDYRRKKQYRAAEDQYNLVLIAREKQLGTDHKDTLHTVDHLASNCPHLQKPCFSAMYVIFFYCIYCNVANIFCSFRSMVRS
jgi:hypothetical protein